MGAPVRSILLALVLSMVLGGCATVRTVRPMAGVNDSASDASIRLVFRDGGRETYLLPAASSVTLPAGREVAAAIVFSPECRVLVTRTFGNRSDQFANGGQIGLGWATNEVDGPSGPLAQPTAQCSKAPAPGG